MIELKNVRGRYPADSPPLRAENVVVESRFAGGAGPPVLVLRLEDWEAPDFWLELEVHGLPHGVEIPF